MSDFTDRLEQMTYIERLEQRLVDDDWTEGEIRRYLNCTEELNPELDEAVAIKRMTQISEEVSARLGRPTMQK